jgi:hypothetical protein
MPMGIAATVATPTNNATILDFMGDPLDQFDGCELRALKQACYRGCGIRWLLLTRRPS